MVLITKWIIKHSVYFYCYKCYLVVTFKAIDFHSNQLCTNSLWQKGIVKTLRIYLSKWESSEEIANSIVSSGNRNAILISSKLYLNSSTLNSYILILIELILSRKDSKSNINKSILGMESRLVKGINNSNKIILLI